MPNTQRAPIASFEISTNTNSAKDAYNLDLSKPITNIGRHPSNDIVIQELVVSAFHLQIVYDSDQFVLVHPHPSRQATANGLLYEGRHIQGNEVFRKPLVHGDVFRIGDQNGTLVTIAFNDGSGTSQDNLPKLPTIVLKDSQISIGRQPDNMVVLNHPQVSGHHARLERINSDYRIVDLGSTNYVYVNGKRVSSQFLNSDDEIRIGPFKFIYKGTYLTQYDESNRIRIDARNLKKFGNKQTILLNDISIAIPPRKFVALVGASGTGKSTLMDALNGLRPADAGTVLYNGQDYYKNLAAFSTQLGYVPQDDIVHRDLTVERALYYAAKIRLPADFTGMQIKQRINEVLQDVEMTDRHNLLVSKLSGGQRKRVSIALELLAKPSVFFLDEPTSGLDPGLDRKMMLLLRRLADRGHTIILVTHATNNINSCDYVCFLTQGGRLAYFGPPNEAKKFFGKGDFAEIYGELDATANPSIPEQVETKFKGSQDYQKYVVDPLKQSSGSVTSNLQRIRIKPLKRGNPWKQFALLSMRYLELLKNDRINLAILLLQAPLIAIILWLLVQLAIGSGGFDSTNVVQCPMTAQVLSSSGLPDIPTPSNPVVSKSCSKLENFLHNDPRGKAYAAKRGGVRQAVQDFVFPGPGDAPKLLFIMAFAAIMFGCINAAREIVKEAPIYRRERTVNLGIVPYMFSKIAVLGALCLLQSAVLVLIVNLFDPFHQAIFLPAALEVYITLALTSLAGLMMGLTLSAIVPNNDRAMSFVPVILIPQVIFSGTLFSLKGWPLQILGALFPVRWAMAALGSSVGLHSDKLGEDKLFGDDYTSHGTLFSTYSQTDATQHLVLIWLALGIMIVVFGVAIGYFLKRKDARR